MANTEKTIYGFIEKVTLTDRDLTLPAKLDTGAKSASLNAQRITEITIKNKPYLQFVVPTKEGDVLFQAEYLGEVNIKTRSGEQHTNPLLRKSVKRPVVLLHIKIGQKERAVRVNLTNRKHFVYPLLLGREAIIALEGMVDPSLKYTQKSVDKK